MGSYDKCKNTDHHHVPSGCSGCQGGKEWGGTFWVERAGQDAPPGGSLLLASPCSSSGCWFLVLGWGILPRLEPKLGVCPDMCVGTPEGPRKGSRKCSLLLDRLPQSSTTSSPAWDPGSESNPGWGRQTHLQSLACPWKVGARNKQPFSYKCLKPYH